MVLFFFFFSFVLQVPRICSKSFHRDSAPPPEANNIRQGFIHNGNLYVLFRFESNPNVSRFQFQNPLYWFFFSGRVQRFDTAARSDRKICSQNRSRFHTTSGVCSLFVICVFHSLWSLTVSFLLLLHRDKQSWLKMRIRCLRTCSGHCFNTLWSVFFLCFVLKIIFI